jgi:hypothetical protein
VLVRDADFLIISSFDKPLHKESDLMEADKKETKYSKTDLWEAQIGAVVVNTHFYPMVEEFKKMFPDLNIIKANELAEYLMDNK